MLLKYGIKYSDLFSAGTRSALDVKAGLLKDAGSLSLSVEKKKKKEKRRKEGRGTRGEISDARYVVTTAEKANA